MSLPHVRVRRMSLPQRPPSDSPPRGANLRLWTTTKILLHCISLKITALHCTAMYCTALHSTALYCTALHCTAVKCSELLCTALHCTSLHFTSLHFTALHFIALNYTALHSLPFQLILQVNSKILLLKMNSDHWIEDTN